MEDPEEGDGSAKEDVEEADGGDGWCACGGRCVGRLVKIRR